jgi:hypothetical protein
MLTGTSAADLTARMKLFARQQRARAIKLRAEAAEIRQQGQKNADRWRGPTAAQQAERAKAVAEAAAKPLEDEATRCDERRAEYEKTELLLCRLPVDKDDLTRDYETRGLYTMCRQAGIIAYEKSQPGSQDYTRQTDDDIKANY